MCSIMAGGYDREFRFVRLFFPCKVVGRVEEESFGQSSGNVRTVEEKRKALIPRNIY